MDNKDGVLLASGGMDSTTMAYWLQRLSYKKSEVSQKEIILIFDINYPL